MEQLIDKDTVAILIVNPSGPCGSVYSKQHLLDILAVAEKHFLPIIADEVYNGLVFKGQHSYPIASLSKNVPVLSCGGIGKKYLVPGWRVGWILIHDRKNRFKKEVTYYRDLYMHTYIHCPNCYVDIYLLCRLFHV